MINANQVYLLLGAKLKAHSDLICYRHLVYTIIMCKSLELLSRGKLRFIQVV